MRNILFLLVLLTTVSFSDTATQTDWSGGGGVPGPVFEWGNSYDVASQIVDSVGLQLGIVPASDPVEYSVDNLYSGSFIYAEDIDGDGDIDVLGASNGANDITWWENYMGIGIIWIEHTIDGDFDGAICVYATDVDGDGDTDVLGAADTDDDITWWENINGIGTSWAEHTIDGDFDGAICVYATDVDGDGDTDVLGAAFFDDEITWWENTDSTGTSWTEHVIDDIYGQALTVYATDVDGDGDTDVLGGAQWSPGYVTWWENMNGSGTSWTLRHIAIGFFPPVSIYATDVDGDGDTDVLGAAGVDDDITWWENINGIGTSWAEHTIDGDFDGAVCVYATDVDGDDDTDVLGAAGVGDDISWWENINGIGTSWAEHTIDGDFDGANCVYATDLDGDGYTDVLGTSTQLALVSWWQVFEYASAGYLESSILDTGLAAVWESSSNNGYQPSGTSLGYQFRSSQDPGNMGAWSDTLYGTNIDLTGILADSTEYIQYKTILQTTDPLNTPILGEITVTYSEYLGIPGHNTEVWSLSPIANPSGRDLTVMVSVQQQEMVHLMMFDITGRLVARYSQELPGGMHSICFNDLFPGIYLCAMHAGDFSTVQRIVVIE